MKSTRVLWLIKGLGPGGAERLLVSTARVGDTTSFDYEVAYLVAHKTTFVADLEAEGVRTQCFGRPGRDLLWPWRLRRLLATGGYDVVHLHSPLLAGVARIARLTLRPARRPVFVSTEHNVWQSYRWPTRLLNALLHPLDSRRWAVSPMVRHSMWPVARTGVEVLTHGIVMSDIRDSALNGEQIRSQLGIGPDAVVAITVANFRPEKGYPDLLQATAEALTGSDTLTLLIVGQGPQQQLIERLHAELSLGDRCRILGYRGDVLSLLHACDFFVISSHFEGFPIALMEAMAMGLPVVATRVGGVPEAVTDGAEGLLVDPGDPRALGKAMVWMTTHADQRREMARAAKEQGRRFDIRNAVAVVEQTYRDVVPQEE